MQYSRSSNSKVSNFIFGTKIFKYVCTLWMLFLDRFVYNSRTYCILKISICTLLYLYYLYGSPYLCTNWNTILFQVGTLEFPNKLIDRDGCLIFRAYNFCKKKYPLFVKKIGKKYIKYIYMYLYPYRFI